MRVLVMASPVPTHLMPLLPQLWALRGAGHQVLLAGQPDLVAAGRSAGLSIAVIGSEQREVEVRRAHRAAGGQDADGGGGSRQEPPWESLAHRLRGRVRDVLGPALRVAEAWRPDLIVADPLEYASLIVGGVLGIPVVHHRWGVDSFSSRNAHVRTALRDICAEHGLDGGLPDPALVLDPCPPTLQHADATPGQPVRFVPSNSTGVIPAWVFERTVRQRVCVTLGLRTVALEGPEVLARLLRGLGTLPDVETVATVDPRHWAELGTLPAVVRLVPPTPLDLFLDGCQAVVHHGGSGTGLAAVAAGLPQLVVPHTPWTAEHGERVEACSAGITIPAAEQQRDPAAIATAAGRLLRDPGYGEGARRLRAELGRMPSPAEVVPVLEALARQGAAAGPRPSPAAGPARPGVEEGSTGSLHSLAVRNG